MRNNYATQYAAFDTQTMQLKKQKVLVGEEETITSKGNKVACRKVTITDAENTSNVNEIWIDVALGTVLKMNSTVGPMKFTYVLK